MEERAKRKLSAILSADVKGYSRLMQEDELVTIRTLEDYRALIAEAIRKYRGRVVDSPGDNVLAEFSSVVDAVESAVEIQKDLKVKNAELPENRRMEFRIGINLGDVVEEGERIYGDGVNIAARIEGLAEGGGICISRTAFGQVKNKLNLGYEYLGEHSVKNIAEPVRVYRVLMEPEAAGKVIGEEKLKPRQWRWAAIAAVAVLIIVAGALAIWNFYLRPPFEPASEERMAFPLPDDPSIAVMAFDNMSGDPNQDYFSDGLSDHIITNLSKVPNLFVIARNSTFTYKGKPVKVQKVAEDLGVRYVLEGSVQKAGDRIRVTAQLIDAIKGHHLWAESYDRDLKDIFAVQDEITFEILKALQVKLTGGEKLSIIGKGTENLEAYQKILQALELVGRFTPEGNIQARQLAEEAIALDPKYPVAYRTLAWTHFNELWGGWSKNRVESFKRAAQIAQKAVELDDTQAGAHILLGMLNLYRRQYEKAIAAGERAVSISPNGAHYNAFFAVILRFAGRPEESIEVTKKAMRLSPIYPAWFLASLGMGYRMTGQYDEAIEAFKGCLERNPEHVPSYIQLIIAYTQLGRLEEARALVPEIFKLRPNFSLKQFAKSLFYKDPAEIQRMLTALRKAGLPETPPLPLPDKPSIAVLPFVNMSGDPEQEYFSDGISEDIITALSKTPKLFVIARHSSFSYKDKSVWIPTVGRELGVQYILEGSVRKAGNKVRISAQLIDAKTNHHIWAEQYDRDLKDIFAVQDDITKNIITALHVKLTEGEQARLSARGTTNLQAYLKASEAMWYNLQTTRDGLLKAKQLSEEAIALDPNYAVPYMTLGAFHGISIFLGMSKSPEESLKRAIELSQQAIDLDDSFAYGHVVLGYWLTMARQYDEAIAEGRRGMALEPNSADVLYNYASILFWAGRYEEAIPLFRDALRLNPIPPNAYYRHFGGALRESGRHEEAIAMHSKAIEKEPNDLISHIALAMNYTYAGRMEEARAAAKEVLKLNPKFTADYWGKVVPHKDPAVTARNVEALKKAGLK